MTLRRFDSDRSALVFASGGTNYAIPLSFVVETVQILPITKIPGVPWYIKGVCDLRGQIVPVIDLLGFFCGEALPETEYHCMLVAEVDDCKAGLLASDVKKVVPLDGDAVLENVGCETTGGFDVYVNETLDDGGDKILVIDVKKVFDDMINRA